jgi:hypothetical protein
MGNQHRFKVWRSAKDGTLHVICLLHVAPTRLPSVIGRLGPWIGAEEGDTAQLRPGYRELLLEQGFVIAHGGSGNFATDAPQV